MDRPSADAFLEAFDGAFYGPVSAPIVGVMHAGWGAYDGRPSSLDLVVSLGPRNERVAIRTALWPLSTTKIVNDLLFRDPTRPFRFPILVERGNTRIAVDSRERVFTTYRYRQHVVATASIGSLSVALGSRARVLRSLRLGLLEPDHFRRLMHDADRFGRELTAKSPR